MSSIIDSIDITGLRPAHFEQLKTYINWAERRGDYCGNRKQFIHRHADLRRWIDRSLELIESDNVKIKQESR